MATDLMHKTVDEPPRIVGGNGAGGRIASRRVVELVESLFPGSHVFGVDQLGGDSVGAVTKAGGYGAPLKVDLLDADGRSRSLVFRTATPNDFGHDHRADRAAEMILAYDTFSAIPQHVRPFDMGAVMGDGTLASLREAGEFYLLTSYANGTVYADRLRHVAENGARAADARAAVDLAGYLAELHSEKAAHPHIYRRAIRDLVGSGEGIFGIVDSYGPGVPGASLSRLQAIEERAMTFRFKLRSKERRAAKIHGDFHPFNIVFDGEAFTLLDASRGSEGEPADDVSALAVNYIFFALHASPLGRHGLSELYHLFLDTYLERSGDQELFDVIAPFLTWRLLVLASPAWYNGVSARDRDALLTLAERALDEGFQPGLAYEIFR